MSLSPSFMEYGMRYVLHLDVNAPVSLLWQSPRSPTTSRRQDTRVRWGCWWVGWKLQCDICTECRLSSRSLGPALGWHRYTDNYCHPNNGAEGWCMYYTRRCYCIYWFYPKMTTPESQNYKGMRKWNKLNSLTQVCLVWSAICSQGNRGFEI